jgi:hypothetical protein
MKKIIILLSLVILISCNCISQLPNQFIYTGQSCTAFLPDYTKVVTVSDNCEIISFIQTPVPGTILNKNNLQVNVILKAIDNSGNESQSNFNVILLDTLSPVFHYPDSMLTYNINTISNIYLTFECWLKENMLSFVYHSHWDSLGIEPLKVYYPPIELTDEEIQSYINRQ